MSDSIPAAAERPAKRLANDQRRDVATFVELALASARDGEARVVLTFDVRDGHAEIVQSLLLPPRAPE